MSHYIALGSTFIPCPKSYNQTRLELKFQIKRKPYTKRILITKENIKLPPITDRDTTTNQSATSTLSSRVIDRLLCNGHRQILALVNGTNIPSLLDLVIFGCLPIGNHLHRQLPCRLVTIAPSADPHPINSRYVSKDTCPKTVSTRPALGWGRPAPPGGL